MRDLLIVPSSGATLHAWRHGPGDASFAIFYPRRVDHRMFDEHVEPSGGGTRAGDHERPGSDTVSKPMSPLPTGSTVPDHRARRTRQALAPHFPGQDRADR